MFSVVVALLDLKNKLKVVFYYEKDHLQGYLIHENTANT